MKVSPVFGRTQTTVLAYNSAQSFSESKLNNYIASSRTTERNERRMNARLTKSRDTKWRRRARGRIYRFASLVTTFREPAAYEYRPPPLTRGVAIVVGDDVQMRRRGGSML